MVEVAPAQLPDEVFSARAAHRLMSEFGWRHAPEMQIGAQSGGPVAGEVIVAVGVAGELVVDPGVGGMAALCLPTAGPLW